MNATIKIVGAEDLGPVNPNNATPIRIRLVLCIENTGPLTWLSSQYEVMARLYNQAGSYSSNAAILSGDIGNQINPGQGFQKIVEVHVPDRQSVIVLDIRKKNVGPLRREVSFHVSCLQDCGSCPCGPLCCEWFETVSLNASYNPYSSSLPFPPPNLNLSSFSGFPPPTHLNGEGLSGMDGWSRYSYVWSCAVDKMFGSPDHPTQTNCPIMALDQKGYFGRTRRSYQVVIVAPHIPGEVVGKYVIRYKDDCCGWSSPSLPTNINTNTWGHVLNAAISTGPTAQSGVYICWPNVPYQVGQVFDYTVSNMSHIPLRGFSSKLKGVVVTAYDNFGARMPVEILLTANGKPVMQRIVSSDCSNIECPIEITSMELTGTVPMAGASEPGRNQGETAGYPIDSFFDIYYEVPLESVRPQLKYSISPSFGGFCLYVRPLPGLPPVHSAYFSLYGVDCFDKSNFRSTEIELSPRPISIPEVVLAPGL